MWHDIKKIMHDHDSFLITTHINPDGDGVGAACAFEELLSLMGKSSKLVIDSPIPKKFQFLNSRASHEVFDPQKDYSEFEVLVVIDTNRKDRIGRLGQWIDHPKMVSICIDHHIPEKPFTTTTAVDVNACSSGSMIYTLYKECGFELTLEAAMGIYASIMCDTGRFSYSSTSRKAHKIADECIKVGVDPDLMYSRLYQQVSLNELRVFTHALQKMETYFDDRVMVQQFCLEDYQALGVNNCEIDLEFIHEFNKLIEDVDCVVLLQELPNSKVRVSARSKKAFNLVEVLTPMGGGGHPMAAGAMCSGTLNDVKTKVLEGLNGYCTIRS